MIGFITTPARRPVLLALSLLLLGCGLVVLSR